jgi:hypothetical protein
MAKKKAKARSDLIFKNLEGLSGSSMEGDDEDTSAVLSLQGQPIPAVTDSSTHPRMKKFRFQLLHQWLVGTFQPCRAADIGGGKGLLSYLLQQDGWEMTVIDPVWQALPVKYKDIRSGARMKIDSQETLSHIQAEFMTQHAADFDLLIGMHAHGCNAAIIDAAARFGCGFVIFPCCVIGEPFYPPLGVHWLESLADYAIRQGLEIHPFRLNFKGQNIGLYTVGGCKLMEQ